VKDLIIYDNMVTAIEKCHRTDEVKNIRDKALALEHYSRQAMNVLAERKAINVRVRAERRAGQLLAGLQKSKGGGRRSKSHSNRGNLSDFAEAKQGANITDTQAIHWQRLAAIPQGF